MTNFVAFEFRDNDFHTDLLTAIVYVVEHKTEELTLESWREFVIRGTMAFGLLTRIDNYNAKYPRKDYRDYIESTLVVTEIKSLGELRKSFEGFIFDTHPECILSRILKMKIKDLLKLITESTVLIRLDGSIFDTDNADEYSPNIHLIFTGNRR